MTIDIKQAVHRVLSTAGIPINPVVLSRPQTGNPMSFYQSMDFSDIEKVQAGLDSFVQMLVNGKCRAFVVSGPAGSSKTSSTTSLLKRYSPTSCVHISGTLSPIMVYIKMYRHSNPGEVIVLDDVDSLYKSLEGMNVIKAATDSGPKRMVSWLTANPLLKAWGIPNTFEFKGGMVLISNESMNSKRGSKLSVHMKAIADRLYHIPMGTDDKEEQFHQLCYYVVKQGMLRARGLSPKQESEILQYITDHYDRLPSITLRTATKLADLMQQAPSEWEALADLSLLEKKHIEIF